MTDDRMHERLTHAGDRWRARQPEGPVAMPRLRARGSRWVVPAAAAVVVAVAGGGWAVARMGQGPSSSGGPATSTSTSPSPTTAGSPTPPLPGPSAHTLRPCSADELSTHETTGVAMGSTYLTITISGPDDACRLQGYPDVALLAGGQPLDVPVHRGDLDSRRVKVTPGPSATLVLGWSPTHSCADVDNDTIRVTLPDGSSFEVPGFGQTTCNPGEADLQPLVVQPFGPVGG